MRGLFGLLIILVVAGVPARQILLRTDSSPWWILLMLVLVANLVALQVSAFSNWPRQSSQPGDVFPNQN